MKKVERRMPVSERAVIQRINRKLERDEGPVGRQVKKSRGARAKIQFGDYYWHFLKSNAVAPLGIEMEALARKLGVLEDWEYLDMEGGRS